jgi:hypothetical protein
VRAAREGSRLQPSTGCCGSVPRRPHSGGNTYGGWGVGSWISTGWRRWQAAVHEAPHHFCRERHMKGPRLRSSRVISPLRGAWPYRWQLLAATLNSAAALSIAVTPSGASTVPSHTSYWQPDRRSSLSAAPVSSFLAMPAVSAASYVGSIRLQPVCQASCKPAQRNSGGGRLSTPSADRMVDQDVTAHRRGGEGVSTERPSCCFLRRCRNVSCSPALGADLGHVLDTKSVHHIK